MLVEPFYLKVVMLICFFLIAGAVDYLIKKEKATRWKEYLFILSLGSVVSLIGLVYDQIIVSISPEYFAVAKGLGYSDLRFNTAMLGMKAGFVAGIIMSGAFLLSNNSSKVFHLFSWLKFIISFTFCMLFLGPVIGYVFYRHGSNPYNLSDLQNLKLLLVWCTQGALYLGAIVATAIACFRIKNGRHAHKLSH